MKFFSSGKMDQVMPSGHMAHSLPRENFKAGADPAVSATMPSTAGNLARNQMIVQQLRSMQGGGKGLSPAAPQAQAPSKIVSNPGRLPHEAAPSAPQRARF
jgi:hypothetical protein